MLIQAEKRPPKSHLVDGELPAWRRRGLPSVLLDLGGAGAAARRYHAQKVQAHLRGEFARGALDDCELVGCEVEGERIAARGVHPLDSAAWVSDRPVVSRLRLRETVWRPELEGFVLSDCTFDGLRAEPAAASLPPSRHGFIHALYFHACSFRRVALRGHVGNVVIDRRFHGLFDGTTDAPCDESMSAFYDGVDWAIDVREARPRSFRMTVVPPDKIVLDPETQCILQRTHADVDLLWSVPGVEYTDFANDAIRLAQSDSSACLLQARRRSKSFDLDRRAITNLRQAGIVS